MLLVGVDENGLGPRLGPLVATAVTLELDGEYDRASLLRAGRRLGVDDSKQSGGFGKMAAIESIALGLLSTLAGDAPGDIEGLLAQVSLDGLLALRAPCPSASAPQCWSSAIALPAFGGDVETGLEALSRLARRKVRCVRARSAVLCASQLNAERERRGSRVAVDLALFERLVLDARRSASSDVHAVLGMVGGIRDYPAYFEHFAPEGVSPGPTSVHGVSYDVFGVGRLAFEIDADSRHFPVALASMLGKYLRELLMERQNRFYAEHLPDLPRPSGYHDKVTKRFVDQSADLRRQLGIVERCFER